MKQIAGTFVALFALAVAQPAKCSGTVTENATGHGALTEPVVGSRTVFAQTATLAGPPLANRRPPAPP